MHRLVYEAYRTRWWQRRKKQMAARLKVETVVDILKVKYSVNGPGIPLKGLLVFGFFHLSQKRPCVERKRQL